MAASEAHDDEAVQTKKPPLEAHSQATNAHCESIQVDWMATVLAEAREKLLSAIVRDNAAEDAFQFANACACWLSHAALCTRQMSSAMSPSSGHSRTRDAPQWGAGSRWHSHLQRVCYSPCALLLFRDTHFWLTRGFLARCCQVLGCS